MTLFLHLYQALDLLTESACILSMQMYFLLFLQIFAEYFSQKGVFLYFCITFCTLRNVFLLFEYVREIASHSAAHAEVWRLGNDCRHAYREPRQAFVCHAHAEDPEGQAQTSALSAVVTPGD